MTREALISQGNTADEALEILRKSWRDQHQRRLQAWNEHLEQQQQEQDRERGLGRGEDPPPNPPPSDKPAWTGRPTPNFLDVRPARHVLKRLEKREYVELWYFTMAGCQDAAARDLAAPQDTFNLVSTDNGLLLQDTEAATGSSRVVKDELLSYQEWAEGNHRLIDCMEQLGWDVYEVEELSMFFVHLDLHPLKSEPYGLQAILRYQDRVRRDWTSCLKIGKAYAISSINTTLLNDYHRQISNEVQAQNNVCALAKLKNPSTDRRFLLSFFTHTPYAPPRSICSCSAPYASAPLHMLPLRSICSRSAPYAPAPLHALLLRSIYTLPPRSFAPLLLPRSMYPALRRLLIPSPVLPYLPARVFSSPPLPMWFAPTCDFQNAQARHAESIRKHEEFLQRQQPRQSSGSRDAYPQHHKPSRSRSPTRRVTNARRRSRSPDTTKKSFRSSTAKPSRQDKLSACHVCLGRHRHHVAACRETTTWNGRKAISSRDADGKILNRRGIRLCSDWQRPNCCSSTSGQHVHKCSGCGSTDHGADSCPHAEP